jgi:inner membrane protein
MRLNPTVMKVLTLLAIVGLLMLALARVGGLVSERQDRAAEARRSIEQSQAGRQALLGPVMRAVCHETWETTETKGKVTVTTTQRREFIEIATPDHLDITGQVTMEPRYRGLFKVNTYVANTKLMASWKTSTPTADNPKGKVSCEPTTVSVALSDSRGLRDVAIASTASRHPCRPAPRSRSCPPASTPCCPTHRAPP